MNYQEMIHQIGKDPIYELPKEMTDIASAIRTEAQGSDLVKAVAGLAAAREKPRDLRKVRATITEECTKIAFVGEAFYALERYSKQKGKTIELDGPSIRMAEMLGQAWTNLDISIREISREEESVRMQSSVWDLEKNVRWTVEINVNTKDIGTSDTRRQGAVYERLMATSSKCIRRCILSAIPHSVLQQAIQTCKDTEKNQGDEKIPQEVAGKISVAFQRYGVQEKEILEYLQIDTFESLTQGHVVQLRSILRAVVDEGQDIRAFIGKLAGKQLGQLKLEVEES